MPWRITVSTWRRIPSRPHLLLTARKTPRAAIRPFWKSTCLGRRDRLERREQPGLREPWVRRGLTASTGRPDRRDPRAPLRVRPVRRATPEVRERQAGLALRAQRE